MYLKIWLTFIFLCLNAFQLIACTCFKPTFEEAVEISDEIFIGKIVKAERFIANKAKDRYDNEVIYWGWKYYFEVEKKWKGNDQSTFITYNRESSSCSFRLDIYQEKFLVYGTRAIDIDPGTKEEVEVLDIFICSRTTPEQNSAEENWFLNDIRKLNLKIRTVKNSDAKNMNPVSYSSIQVLLLRFHKD